MHNWTPCIHCLGGGTPSGFKKRNVYKVWGCPEKDPKGEFHSPIRFTTAFTAPSLLLPSLLNLYKCAAKRKAQAKRATRCAAEKRKARITKNAQAKPYNY